MLHTANLEREIRRFSVVDKKFASQEIVGTTFGGNPMDNIGCLLCIFIFVYVWLWHSLCNVNQFIDILAPKYDIVLKFQVKL